MNIITNNISRPIFYGYDLPTKIRSEFDYHDNDEDLDCAMFFKYKGQYYDISQFTKYDNTEGWQGWFNLSYFSGLFIKFTNDNEFVIVASYYN